MYVNLFILTILKSTVKQPMSSPSSVHVFGLLFLTYSGIFIALYYMISGYKMNLYTELHTFQTTIDSCLVVFLLNSQILIISPSSGYVLILPDASDLLLPLFGIDSWL